MTDGNSAASTDDVTTSTDTTETTTLPATGDTTTTDQVVATDSTDSDDEGDVKPESDDGKISAVKVNEIVKRRVEKVRTRTREEAEAKAADEIEFWKGRAKEQKIESAIVHVPPKPELKDYASNPGQYEKDMGTWSELKSRSEQYTNNVMTAYNARVIEFMKDKPDYEKSVSFFKSVTISPALESSVLESDLGPALSYYLSKNFKEFDRINKLSPISIARELGKLELKLTGQLKEVAPVVNKQVVPKPTTPVTGNAPSTSTNPATLVKTDEGKLKFLEERKKAHRRGSIVR